MLEELKSITSRNKEIKDTIKENHKDMKLLNWYENIPSAVKGVCFAALMATTATGCSTTGNFSNAEVADNSDVINTQQNTSDEIPDNIDGSDFYKHLAELSPENLVEYEQSREYSVDDLEAPIYNIDQLTEMFKNKTLFENASQVYIENPYENGRLVKVTDERGKYTFGGFGKSYNAPMHMENPQLFSMDKDKNKEGLKLGIDLDEMAPNKTALSFKSMLLHELTHANLAQEIIVHTHHDRFSFSQVGMETKRLLGMDLSNDSAFHTRKLLESHSDISAMISLKIHENMTNEEFQYFLLRKIDEQSISEFQDTEQNDEHQSFRAYTELLELIRKNPDSFKNTKLEEVPFIAIGLVFDAGFYGDGIAPQIRGYLDKREGFNEEVFMGSLSRDIIVVKIMAENIGGETLEIKKLNNMLYEAREYRENQSLEFNLSKAIESYKEYGNLPVGFSRNTGIDNDITLSGLMELKDNLIKENSKTSPAELLESVNNQFEKVEKEWELKQVPEGYRDSPFYSKYRI